MKLIQFFFACLSQYTEFKYKLKCDYEILKMECRIKLKNMNKLEEIKKGFYFSIGVVAFVALAFIALSIGKLLAFGAFELIKPFL